MGFFKRFRRQRALKKSASLPHNDLYEPAPYAYYGPDQTYRLPDTVLRRIFEHVCPHSADETLNDSEHSGNDGCMSCDMRDLAHCALTRRQWYGIAAGLLYNSIRIDAVHYCPLEEWYSVQRQRKSRNGDEIDAPTLRLQQLSQSVRDNQYLGQRVRLIKLPYMTRESCKANLARVVSCCPNLEFVDLPDGFYNADPSCQLLRQELHARCPHIRKMRYIEGGEQALESLLQGYWQELQVVELNKIHMEPSILRQVLGVLPQLSELILTGVEWMNDSTFHGASGLPCFPALQTLKLEKVHGVTTEGMTLYLSSPVCGNRLKSLSIKNCSGLPPASLPEILYAAYSLRSLDYTAVVSALLTIDPLPPMASKSLFKLNYEIITSKTYQAGAPYYQYLAQSLLANGLPALRQLYVRDPGFEERLTLVPPILPFSEAPPPVFHHPLELYVKGLDEQEWSFTSILPPDSPDRPMSMTDLRSDKGLGQQRAVRKSVLVQQMPGQFLRVPPVADGRPHSAGNLTPSGRPGHDHSKSLGHFPLPRASRLSHRASQVDLWR